MPKPLPAVMRLLDARAAEALPDDLGPWYDAAEIAQEHFNGHVSPKWVLLHVAPKEKRLVGRKALWRKAHVDRWVRQWEADQARRSA